ncbi:MAG TPA: S24 family peptidase [Alphaproteobacteria bacterium]|nr:S24 family peptidase [Alphaproteobacteria bacterium]
MTETLPDRLDRLMREAGYNPRSLSLRAGLGITAVRDIVDGRIASPRYQTLEALARVLGVGVGLLANGTPDAPNDMRPDSDSPRDLPVYGAAQGGSDGAMLVSSEPIQRISQPLATVRGGYGVYIVGESMSPAYEQGDVALVHPGLPPRRGADVILIRQEPDGTRHVLVKRLIGWTEESWRLRQYNPAAEFELPRAEWTEVQTIVGKYNAR